MAYQDALFQLGMDLTRSSTAQKEDLGLIAPIAHSAEAVSERHEPRRDLVFERDGARFAGHHLSIDVLGARNLDDVVVIKQMLRDCSAAVDATLLDVHVHGRMALDSMSGLAAFAEGHISIHACPRAGYAGIDVLVRIDASPEAIVDVLRDALGTEQVHVVSYRRGGGPVRPEVPVRAQQRSRKVRAA